MSTLIINAHPDFKSENSFSLKLKDMFLDKYNLTFPNEKPEVLNLYETEIPRIDTTQLLNIWEKQRMEQPLSKAEQKMAATTSNLMAQFKNNKRIVIVSPMHNFNITSRMKDYMDNILIARQTFKYTSEGSVGLMDDNYKALLLQASGSIYTNDDRYTPLEFSYHYLREMFENIMGFDAFYIARAEGTAILPEEVVLKNAEQDLTQVFHEFYER